MRFLDYMKTAFLNHYNLLLYGTGIVFAFLSGSILGGVAFFTALELIYLTAMSSNPRFQRMVDAVFSKERERAAKEESDRRLLPVYNSLSVADRNRFDAICGKCKALQKGVLMGDSEGMTDITDAQASDVNRLLWIFLKILVARKTVSNFVTSVSESDLQKEVKKQEARLKGLGSENPNEGSLAKQKGLAIQDMLHTANKRLDNLVTTRGNIEIFDLRLEQIESKLNALSEAALNRHDSSSIATSIDSIARDVEISEGTINELKDATGITLKFEEAPAIMSMNEPRERGSGGPLFGPPALWS
jgi:hypothetical protein